MRFSLDGVYHEVTVDERLTVLPKPRPGDVRRYGIAYASSLQPAEFWVALVEKAYARLRGSYPRINVSGSGGEEEGGKGAMRRGQHIQGKGLRGRDDWPTHVESSPPSLACCTGGAGGEGGEGGGSGRRKGRERESLWLPRPALPRTTVMKCTSPQVQ